MNFKYTLPVLFFASLIFIAGCDVTGDFVYIGRTCFDTDNGRTYDVAGKVTLNTREYIDSCTSSGKITEYYCRGTHLLGTANAPCSIVGKSGCFQGECTNDPVTALSKSIDSDGGKNFDEFGIVTMVGGKEYADYCLNSVWLREYYIRESQPSRQLFINHHCDSCKDGACV